MHVSWALAFINAAWQGPLLAALVWFAIRILRIDRHASTASATWLITFALIAVLPAIDAAAQRTVAVPSAPPGAGLGRTELAQLAAHRPATFVRRIGADALRSAARVTARAAVPLAALVWVAISIVLLVRLARAYAALDALKRRARPAPELQALLAPRATRGARIAVSDEIPTACAAGFVRPMILLPRSEVEALDRADLARVIAHEYGHLARYDDWTNAAIRAVCALFFAFPALAFAARQVECARERACDDVAISRTGDGTAYARLLARLAERALRARRMAAAPGFGASDIFARVDHALDDRPHRGGGMSVAGIAFVIAVIVVAGWLARLGLPRVVASQAQPAVATPVAQRATSSSGGALLDALAANGFGRIDAADLARLSENGVGAADVVALPNDRSIDTLIRLRDHGVTPDEVKRYVRSFPDIDADAVIELADNGVTAGTVAAFSAADASLTARDIVQLSDHGVEPGFVQRLAAHGYTRIGADKLAALRDAGFTP